MARSICSWASSRLLTRRPGDGLEAAQLLREVGEAHGVVGVGPAHVADHGEVLAVRPGDGVQHAHREGHGPRRVPGVELVAASHEPAASG
jgi:hypothetical protein